MSRFIPAVSLLACVAAVAGAAPAAPVPAPAPVGEQERLLARGKRFAERGQVDLLVAVTAAWKLKADDRRQWEPAADLGRKLIGRAGMKREPQSTPSSYKDFATYVERWNPGFTLRDDTYVRPDPDRAVPRVAFYYEAIQAAGVTDPAGIAHCLILSRGKVQTESGLQGSVVFANGDVTAKTIIQSAVIVSDGDVTVADPQLGRSLIVARGNITAPWGDANIVLMAGGKVTVENKAARKKDDDCRIVEGEPNTLGVTFFELATVGIEVKVVGRSIRVSAVAAGGACAKAGVRVGDVILEVGVKAATAESLRRLLRDALAVGDATVTLARGDKTETVKVSLPD